MWNSDRPTNCQLCHGQLKDHFVDGSTTGGSWAIMCTTCHTTFGRGLGTGWGQKYDLITLEKVEG